MDHLEGLRINRVLDGGFAFEEFFNALQAHLAGLEGAQGEAQQGGWEHQPFDIEDQCHKATETETAGRQLATANGKQHQQ